jgi:tetratricopeptide (TPR) repeat protein
LSRSLSRPLLLYVALIGQWRYSLSTDKLTTTLQFAKRVYSLAEEQNDSALMIGAYRALSVTLCYLGDFQTARRNAIRGVKIWRSESVQSSVEEVMAPAVVCLGFEALSEWYLGEIASCHTAIAEAISLAQERNDMTALAIALYLGGILAHFERNPAEVERCASNMIELSTRLNFPFWLAMGTVYRGWARSASGDTAEGIPWIVQGIEDYRATGSITDLSYFLALKAESLYLADRTLEALEAIREAEQLAKRIEIGCWYAELHRLRGVFLAALGADETQIGASFSEAIKIAREQKSVSLEKRAQEGTTQGTLRYDPISTHVPVSIAAFPRENTRIGAADMPCHWPISWITPTCDFPKCAAPGLQSVQSKGMGKRFYQEIATPNTESGNCPADGVGL